MIFNFFKKRFEYRRLKKSGLFDKHFYLRHYPDVRDQKVDPLLHYINFGAHEKRQPNEFFDTAYYLRNYPEITDLGINPLYYYLKKIKTEAAETVNVLCRTYNHEKTIAKCLDGIIMQKTRHKIKIIIGDDGSRDDTLKIISSYQKRYPHYFRKVCTSENAGSVNNLVKISCFIGSQYVAICDGDDYWTDPAKLEKQVGFLQNNPDYTVCFHKVIMNYPGETGKNRLAPAKVNTTSGFNDLLKGNYIYMSSVVYRWQFPEGLKSDKIRTDVLPFDWQIHLLHSLQGKIRFFPKAMSVYTRDVDGMWYLSDAPDELHLKYGVKEIKLFQHMLSFAAQQEKDFLKGVQKKLITTLIVYCFKYGVIEKLKYLISEFRSLVYSVLGIENADKRDTFLKEIDKGLDPFRKITISVVITAYNHEKYLRKCIDSVLKQRGNFNLEIIIGDDYSTDNSNIIINDFQKDHKNIKVLKTDKNLGMLKNLERCFAACTGDFIAVCEGDDYWLSNLKLLKQLVFLLANKDCDMCFNWLLLKKEEQGEYLPHPQQGKLNKTSYSFNEVIKSPFIGNFSCCFYRAEAVHHIPEKYYKESFAADWLFNSCIAFNGKVGFVKELLSVYRIHDKGQWSGKSKTDMKKQIRKTQNTFIRFFKHDYYLDFIDDNEVKLSLLKIADYAILENMLLEVDIIRLVHDELLINGWHFFYDKDPIVYYKKCLALEDVETGKVYKAYNMKTVEREDVLDYLGYDRQTACQMIGFSFHRKIELDRNKNYRLIILLAGSPAKYMYKTNIYLRRTLNTWKITYGSDQNN